MTVDTNFNFYGLIIKCCELLDLDTPTTWEDTEETEYKKLKNVLNALNRSIILSEFERWTFRDITKTITLTLGENSYDRPNGMIASLKIAGQSSPMVSEYPDAWNYITIGTGMPTKYTVYGEHILFNNYPTSVEVGTVITCKYCTQDCGCTRNTITGDIETYKPNMDLETDFSIIPTQYLDALIYGACRDYKGMPDRPKYQHFNSRYTQEIRQMRKAMKRSLDIEPYFDVGGSKSNQDMDWVDYWAKESWR